MKAGNKIPQRILFINYSLETGGIETLLLEICRYMVTNSDIQPAVCAFEPGGKLEPEFEDIGVPVHILPKRSQWEFRLPFMVRRLIKKKKYDLVHVHNQNAWLYGGLGAILARKPLLYTEHTSLDKFSAAQKRRWQTISWMLSTQTLLITTVARHLIPNLVNKINIPEHKIHNIYNGIDLKPYEISIDRSNKLAELGVPTDSRVVGVVASLTEAKRHTTMIRAFAIVKEQIPDAVLLIVGEGSLRDSLITQTENLGLKESVYFTGVRRDIPELLQIFDVFALSSVIEGLPISVLEAMASSRPVVATDIPGTNELVVSGETGLLVEPTDHEAFAQALISLLSSKEMMVEMGRKGREHVARKFSFGGMASQYVSTYRQILEGVPVDKIDLTGT